MVEVHAEPRGDGWLCSVTVDQEGVRTVHAVTVSASDVQRWARSGDREDVERLVASSFDFLLAREPPGAILGSFDLSVIQRYFPEFDSTFAKRTN
jgi:hypothetical protein